MASGKAELSRASTIELTAQDGRQFLERNLTEWKKPYLMDQFNDESEDKSEEEPTEPPSAKKPKLSKKTPVKDTAKAGKQLLDKDLTPWKNTWTIGIHNPYGLKDKTEEEPGESMPAKKLKLSKHTTMKGTAKEAAVLLASGGPDEDVFTRGQQKALSIIKNEKPPTKKVKMARDNTMVATAKEGQALIGKRILADTRQKKKRSIKRSSSTAAVVAEAEKIYGKVDTSSARKLRKQSGKPLALKKAGTMEKTAKEGKEFLSRKRKQSRK